MTNNTGGGAPISRCTGRIPVPSDSNASWTPDLLAQLFPPEKRIVWVEMIDLTIEQLNEEPTAKQYATW